MVRILIGAAARTRLEDAREFLLSFSPSTGILVVAQNRENSPPPIARGPLLLLDVRPQSKAQHDFIAP